MPRFNKVRGGALLTALFIMTLVAIVATAMTTRLQLDIYRTRLVVSHDKLYMASQAVTFWAMGELNDRTNKFTKVNKKGMVDVFPLNLEAMHEGAKLSGGIYDLQARYNLNNLLEKRSMAPFVNLLSHTVPEFNNNERIGLAIAVQDWLQAYDLSKGKDSYTSYYLAQKPPYYPSHQLFKSASELRLVKDVSAPVFMALSPYITALPETTPININTASKKILLSLANGLNETQVSELISARGEQGVTDLKEIAELLKKLDLSKEQITIESQFFLAVASASNNEFGVVVYSLLKRTKDKQGKISVSVIQESINNYQG